METATNQTAKGWGIDNGHLWPNTFDTRRDAIRWLEDELKMTWKEIQKDKRIKKIRIVPVEIVRLVVRSAERGVRNAELNRKYNTRHQALAV